MTRGKDLTRFDDGKSEKEYVKAEASPSSCTADKFPLHHDAEATMGSIGLSFLISPPATSPFWISICGHFSSQHRHYPRDDGSGTHRIRRYPRHRFSRYRKDGKREGEGKGEQGRTLSAAPSSMKVGMVFKAAAAPPVLTLPSLPSGFTFAKPRRSSAEETKAAPQCLTEGLTRPIATIFGDEYWSSALCFLLRSACVVAG
ncbi:hypothetical protein EmuJ_000731200 [Echinococcus multilocularis]|uniref:Uncharacterized protein n=1 Tax=Echinococcus multilocularis TaxID=6211 RepID=A0A068YBS1_ECHMU|nr:hypothetical protein EmuJ_000731200 [Echinococcus multilocularis]